MKKKFLKLIILPILLLISGCAQQPRNTLSVGITLSNQDFLDQDILDIDKSYVRDLIFGYNCVSLDPNQEYIWNLEAIQEPENPSIDEHGNLIYTMIIKDNKWNNGTILSSQDYIFALLARTNMYSNEHNIASSSGASILGYEDYINGVSDYLTGIKLINDKIFTITLDKEKVSKKINKEVFDLLPLPMDSILDQEENKKISILSNDYGSKIDSDVKEVCAKVEKYAKNPLVTSGPYKITSNSKNEIALSKNKYFTKDANGETPTMENIVLKNVTDKVKAFKEGNVDLISGVFNEKQVKELKGTSSELLLYTSNTNAGIYIEADDSDIKKAIATFIDKDEIVKINDMQFKIANGDYSSLSLEKMQASSYVTDVENTNMDKVKASQTLQSTFSNQLTYLGIKDNPISLAISKQLKVMCDEIGIAYKEESVSVQEYYAKDTKEYDICFVMYEAMQEWNDSSLIKAKNVLLDADNETIHQAWLTYQNLYMNTMPILPVVIINYGYICNDAIKNIDVYGLNQWAKNVCQYKF